MQKSERFCLVARESRRSIVLVKEMLSLPSFAEATVVAGASHLDNEIESAMILEGPDIQNWGRRNQLIISSYFALEGLDSVGLGKFFRTMSTIGIGALAIKPGRAVDEIPREIVDLCEDFDLPLIRLSPQVKYEAILMDVLGHVLDTNLTLLNRFYESHRHIMTLALKQPSIPYILNTLKNSLMTDTTYLDTQRDRRLSTNSARAAFTGYSFERHDPGPYQTHAYFDARLFYQKEASRSADSEPCPRGTRPVQASCMASADANEGADRVENALAIRIPSSDGVDYYLIIHSDGTELSQVDTMLVENIVSLLQIEILKQNAVKQKLFYQNNNTVHDLLLGRFNTHERVNEALALLNIDQFPLYEVLLVRSALLDPSDTDRQDELHQTIRRRLRSAYPGIVYYVNSDRLLILHNFRSELSGIDIEEVQRTLSKLHESSTLPLFTHFAVLSSTADRYSLPEINNDVMNAYKLFDDSSYRDVSIRFDDLGIYKLLLGSDEALQQDRLIDPRLTRMHDEQPDLFNTLVRLCENGLSYPKTAEDLFLHPKTVRYRVERAREVYRVNVKDPNDYLQIILASKIYTLRKG